MSDNTGIEWTDATWNPVTGCTEVSPGCDHCYAKTFAERFRGVPGHHFENGFDLQLRPGRLDQPLRWTRGRRIFVNSMSDLFHDDVPDYFIAQTFAIMSLASQHTFQLLTKRHGRMRSLLNSLRFRIQVDAWEYQMAAGLAEDPATGDQLAVDPARARAARETRRLSDGSIPPRWPLPNVWLGVSVENQQWANIRIPALLNTPAAVRFLSCEPLLGPVSIFANSTIDTGTTLVDWVIVGGESGRGARPMHPDWVRGLRNECADYGIAFHFKQWGEHVKVDRIDDAQPGDVWALGEGGHPAVPWRPDTRGAEAHRWGPHRDQLMRRVGKKAAGRMLDGRTHDEFPAVAS